MITIRRSSFVPWAVCLLFVVVSAFTACGGGGSTGSSVTVSPTITLRSVTESSTGPVPLGATQQVTVTGTFSDGTSQNVASLVAWTSSAPAVVTVNASGLLTGVSQGTAIITGSIQQFTFSFNVSVGPPILKSIA